VQKHICVLGLFLPSFRYIFCIAYITNIVFIDYHFFPMLFVGPTFHLDYQFLLEILDW